MAKHFLSWPEIDHTFELDGLAGLNSSIVGWYLKPWDQRIKTAMQLQPVVQKQFESNSRS